MNYYNEIKNKLIDNEVYKRVFQKVNQWTRKRLYLHYIVQNATILCIVWKSCDIVATIILELLLGIIIT